MEFKSFSEIIKLSSMITITEKIHGTNAQIFVHPDTNEVQAGSRERWVTPEDDNFGFARWAKDNEEALVLSLGPGRHFGEWYGSGINSGYSLSEKRLALFDQRFGDAESEVMWTNRPANVHLTPILYKGIWKENIISDTMAALKLGGSVAAPGYMKPEGVVVRFERNGAMFKQVFEAEESGWKNKEKKPKVEIQVDEEAVNALLQPIRLEKLLSRDERYVREYPKSLSDIAKAYYADMVKEDQFLNVDADVLTVYKKRVFPWIKQSIETPVVK